MIDAHQHFWSVERDDYGWLSPSDEVLYRDYAPEHLLPLITEAKIDATVLVQAAPTLAETRYLLGIAAECPFVAAVVGWVDLAGRGARDSIGELAADPVFRGVRPMIQDIENVDWMLDAGLSPALGCLVERGLRFDALVRPRHLPNLLRLLARHPDLQVVIDHGAKPAIAAADFSTWSAGMAELARETSACCKLSGLVTEAGPDWSLDSLRPYVDHLLEHFGPTRLLWGSDWPVVELAGGFARWREATLEMLGGLTDDDRSAILGETAKRFYGLEAATP